MVLWDMWFRIQVNVLFVTVPHTYSYSMEYPKAFFQVLRVLVSGFKPFSASHGFSASGCGVHGAFECTTTSTASSRHKMRPHHPKFENLRPKAQIEICQHNTPRLRKSCQGNRRPAQSKDSEPYALENAGVFSRPGPTVAFHPPKLPESRF